MHKKLQNNQSVVSDTNPWLPGDEARTLTAIPKLKQFVLIRTTPLFTLRRLDALVQAILNKMAQRFGCSYSNRLVQKRAKENIFYLSQTNAYFLKATQRWGENIFLAFRNYIQHFSRSSCLLASVLVWCKDARMGGPPQGKLNREENGFHHGKFVCVWGNGARIRRKKKKNKV
jgi:hypothetical protein